MRALLRPDMHWTQQLHLDLFLLAGSQAWSGCAAYTGWGLSVRERALSVAEGMGEGVRERCCSHLKGCTCQVGESLLFERKRCRLHCGRLIKARGLSATPLGCDRCLQKAICTEVWTRGADTT